MAMDLARRVGRRALGCPTRHGAALPAVLKGLPRAGASTSLSRRVTTTGRRMMSTNQANSNRWGDEDTRMFLLRTYIDGLVARQQASCNVYIEKVRTGIISDVSKCLRDTTWVSVGVLAASLSATLTVAHSLYDRRCLLAEQYFEWKLDVLHREIKLLKLEMSLYGDKTTDSYTSHAEQVYNNSADRYTKLGAMPEGVKDAEKCRCVEQKKANRGELSLKEKETQDAEMSSLPRCHGREDNEDK